MELLYQDAQIAVCIKPQGVLSEAGPGSLPGLLQDALGGSIYPVHRLDRNVGGVMVYARTKAAAAALSRAIQDGGMAKEYLALIHGRPMGPEGVWEDLLWKDKEKNHVFVVRRMRKGVKAAKLAYRTLEARENLTLVHIRLYTGRSHQIRVQFATRGLPLAADHKYGSRDKAAAPALWSFRLTFPHPSTGRMLTFCRPPAGEIWSSFSSAFPEASPWDGPVSEGGSKSAVFKEGDPAHVVR